MFLLLHICLLTAAYTSSFVLSQDSIFLRLNNDGFIELENKILLKTDFKTLYDNFDSFIEHMETDEQFSKNIDELEKKYVSNTQLKKRYCSAPPSYRDPRKNTQKRFNKVYFQFMKEYHDMALDEHKEMLAEKKGTTDFLCGMKKLDDTAKVIFSTLIDQIDAENPGFKQLMYGKHNELTVISKIVRYNKTESWGTTPHRDKSALTLIWDSDDKNDESLSLCRNLHKPSLKNLEVPKRMFSGKDNCSSTLLIPGLSLQQSGINLPGTVHGVLPFTHEYRHAVISFLLIPDIDMSHIQSDFVE